MSARRVGDRPGAARHRHDLPQRHGGRFLADGGLETDLIFRHGVRIREFAAHTLLADPTDRERVARYFRPYLALAREHGLGFVLNSQTWKAHPRWAADLGASEDELREANRDSVAFIAGLREEFADAPGPIVLAGIIGPTSDAYAPETKAEEREAEQYHARQIEWLAATEVDMVTATTFPHAEEAIGLVRAARTAGMPVVVSFTVETDGRLPCGVTLRDAVRRVDDATGGAVEYFQVNCAHPDHFFHVFDGSDWTRRIRGLRCNASRRSHAELDACTTLDDGDPDELGERFAAVLSSMPWLQVVGGCCGTDLRHVARIASAASLRRGP